MQGSGQAEVSEGACGRHWEGRARHTTPSGRLFHSSGTASASQGMIHTSDKGRPFHLAPALKGRPTRRSRLFRNKS